MTIFVDASALVAIIAGESEAEDLSNRLQADLNRICSTVSIWEAVAGLVRSYGVSVSEARRRVGLYCQAGAIHFVPLGEREYELAIDAYDRFGKGRHPAALNMGDCHAYACARANGAHLLFKGDDFSKTDIPTA